MKKETKDKSTMKASEVGVLIEELRREFKVFGESQEFIKDKVNSTWIQTGKNTESITRLDINMSFMKNDMAKMKTDISKLEADVSGINGRIANIETDVSGMNGRIANIETDVKAIKNDFGPRLTRLETIK